MKIKILTLLFCGLFLLTGCNEKTRYTIDNFKLNEIASVTIDTLEQFDNLNEFYDEESIQAIYRVFQNKERHQESIYDNPTDPDLLFLVTFKDKEGNSKSMYIYERDNQYYIEQPYNGIYESSANDFNVIQDFVKQE